MCLYGRYWRTQTAINLPAEPRAQAAWATERALWRASRVVFIKLRGLCLRSNFTSYFTVAFLKV